MTAIYLVLVVLITLRTFDSSECSLNSNLRKLSIQVGGTSYSHGGGSIPSLKPISSSRIYSAKKPPAALGRSKSNLGSSENLSRLVERNGDIMNRSKDSFENIPFSASHTLRLILANKIIQSNPILYPFDIEFKQISSCQCRIDFEKVKRSYLEKNGLEEPTKDDDLDEFTYYSGFVPPDTPPDCTWSESTENVLDKLIQDKSTNNTHIQSTSINSTNNLTEFNLNIENFNVDQINEDGEGSSFLENVTLSQASVIIMSLDGLLQCIYRIPVDNTPWRKSRLESGIGKSLNESKSDNDNENESKYWFNYPALNSDFWREVDFNGEKKGTERAENGKARFSIEGFWDLIRLIPNAVLSSLDASDEATYNLCKNERDDSELMVIDTLIKSLNISREDYMLPTFSLLRVQPYNSTYCSRPTGAELDMIGICPSNGLNSVYDYQSKSCISITYTDSVAFCPLSHSHSKLWGAHRGGGGCHVKQRKYLPPIPKCDKPFVYNEPRETCVVETYAPGFPGCIEGSVYYDLQTCIMAYQVPKEYNCPKGYTADLDDDIFQKDVSDVNYRKDVLNEASKSFIRYYSPNVQEDPIMTRKVNDSESGVQSKSITMKLKTSRTKVKCTKKETQEVRYNGIGAPYCQNNTFSLKYNYTNSWMFESGPKPLCEYQDLVFVDLKCPRGTIPYDSYISSGGDPPIVYRHEFTNPYDTCIQVMKVPIQPKCTTKEELPFISIREPLNYFEKTGIHIVTKEDIDNIDKDSLYNPSEVIDSSPIGSLLEDEVESIQNVGTENATLLNETIAPSFGNSIKNLGEFIALNQLPIAGGQNQVTGDEISESVTRRRGLIIQDPDSGGQSDNSVTSDKKRGKVAPISLYDAIIGRTNYVIKIICIKVVTAKPYLSCPENTVLVASNMCKMKGYTDFTVECPKGYKLDEEALLLLPPEHYRKAPPRCVSKQTVFTHYYCPPAFPDNVFRPFEYNMTKLYSLIIEKMENGTKHEDTPLDNKQPDRPIVFDNFINDSSTVMPQNATNMTKDANSDLSFDYFNTSNFNIENISKYNITNTRVFSMTSFGRTVVPSYSQKMCHEVELIRPLWTMPLLLRLLLNNIKPDKQ
ncbi:oocyst wall protein 9 [Cryptosporidium canis]|nr:oocyst wall protein 9 [Cryptosporidium canis]